MEKILIIILVVALFTAGLCPGLVSAQVGANGIYFPPPGESLSSQSIKLPEELGLSATTVSALQSVITGGRWALWRHGYLIHIEGDFNLNTDIGAASTGIHAATVGVALERSLLASLDEKISVWNTELTGKDAEVSWRHILSQTSTLDDPVALPGDVWAYSSANAYQLNRALSRLWGRTDLTDNYDAVLADALLDPVGARAGAVQLLQTGSICRWILRIWGESGRC